MVNIDLVVPPSCLREGLPNLSQPNLVTNLYCHNVTKLNSTHLLSLLLLDLLAALLRRRWRLRLDLGLVLLAALLWGRLEVLLLLKPSCDQTLSSMWPDVINVTRYYLFVVLLLDLLLLVGLGLDVLLLLLKP